MQMSLRQRITDDCCIFPDVMDIYEAGGKAAYDYIAQGVDFEDKLARAGSLATKTHGWCVQHQRYCPFQTGAGLRIGGFPCTDFSSAGKQLGLQGPNLPIILGYGQKAQATGNDLLAIENVPSCPEHLVHDAFGDSYTWCAQQIFSPSDVGFDCINRPRPELHWARDSVSWA